MNAVLLCNRCAGTADVADLGGNAVSSTGRAANGTLPLERIKDLRTHAKVSPNLNRTPSPGSSWSYDGEKHTRGRGKIRTETRVLFASIATRSRGAKVGQSQRKRHYTTPGDVHLAAVADVPSVTWCHQVAFSGSLGPQPVMFAPYASRVLYSYSYAGPNSVCKSSWGNKLTSLFHLQADPIERWALRRGLA